MLNATFVLLNCICAELFSLLNTINVYIYVHVLPYIYFASSLICGYNNKKHYLIY